MKAIGNYVICVPDTAKEVKTASGLYLDASKESEVFRVVSSGIPEIKEGDRIACDETRRKLKIGGNDYVMVHKEYIFAVI